MSTEGDEKSMARMAAQMRDDYAWLLAHCSVLRGRWNEAITVDDQETTWGEFIVEMASNRFRYQSEDHLAAFDAMRAMYPAEGGP